jgi:hypothetical protein
VRIGIVLQQFAIAHREPFAGLSQNVIEPLDA